MLCLQKQKGTTHLQDIDDGIILLPHDVSELIARKKVLDEHVLHDAIRYGEERGIALEGRRVGSTRANLDLRVQLCTME